MNTCPKCLSTKINRYRHIGGKVWCTDCGYVIKEEGWRKEPKQENVVEHVENYLDDCFMNHLGGLKTQETTCYGSLLESSFIGECDKHRYEIKITRTVK